MKLMSGSFALHYVLIIDETSQTPNARKLRR